MEKYDIIIQGGQSNAEGSGRGPVLKAYEPSEDIYYLDVEYTLENVEGGHIVHYTDKPFILKMAEERETPTGLASDFALTFAKKYIEDGRLEKGRKLLIIRSAIGGTGYAFGHWGVGRPLHEKMLEMTDYALSLNPNENRIVAFLWHQGEHEAVYGTTTDTFRTFMLDTINSVRTRYALPSLPFICADFVQHWKRHNLSICEPIIKELQNVVDSVDSAMFIRTENLPSNDRSWNNGDTIHFSRQALYELGERYYLAYKLLTNKQ